MKTKLQIKREEAGLIVEQLAEKSEQKEAIAFDTKCSYGGMLHYINIIRYLEGKKVVTPRPRKTIEYKYIAKALKCKVTDLVE